MRPGLVIAGLALLLAGCPKEKEETPNQDDRLLKKLQAEKDRLANGGSAARPALPVDSEQPNPLAQRAAMPDKPKTLSLPGDPSFAAGKAALRISGVETSHNVAGDKLSLTTDDYFFKVTLTAQVPGGGPVDLSAAKLVAGGQDYPIARDAQRLAGTHELTRTLTDDEKLDVVLFFEAPMAAVAPGLKLVVAGGDGVSLQ
jgi:hypothetical protein